MQRLKLGCILGVIVAVSACESSTAVTGSTQYTASMNGAQEKPNPTASTATGFFTASLNPSGTTLSYSLTWSGLTGAVTGAHIHGPADANAIAGILVSFSPASLPAGSTNGTLTTTATGAASGNINLAGLTGAVSGDSLKTLLNAGLLYANVHTAANGGGEIRGQIAKQQ